MSTFKDYEYRPPNVRAIQWDGTSETADALMKAAPLAGSYYAIQRSWSSVSRRPVLTLFFGDNFGTTTEVTYGTYVVIESDGRARLANPTEFKYNYRTLADNTSDYVDDEICDLGEHPDIQRIKDAVGRI